MPIGMCIGISVGMAIGAAVGNIAMLSFVISYCIPQMSDHASPKSAQIGAFPVRATKKIFLLFMHITLNSHTTVRY